MAGGLVATGGGSGDINALIHSGSWYSNSRLIKLNAWLLLLLITSSTNGYDGASSLRRAGPFLNPASSFLPPQFRNADFFFLLSL